MALSLNDKLVVAIDTIVAGVHFPPHISAADIGYRALAVNLSDIAAMGAEPSWFTLSLSMPGGDEPWIEAFSAGLFELAEKAAEEPQRGAARRIARRDQKSTRTPIDGKIGRPTPPDALEKS